VKKASTTSRILAALALVGSVAAVLVVVSSQTGSDTTPTPAAKQGKKANAGKNDKPGRQGEGRGARVYEVQEGDSLTAIAEQTGIPIESIEELNPDIDPQALIPGQELKLR
jgi:LysM repeat protein